jgi:hypothetical protein
MRIGPMVGAAVAAAWILGGASAPVFAAGGVGGGGGTAGGGGGAASSVVDLVAQMVPAAGFSTAMGSTTFKRTAVREAVGGGISNTGLPAETWIELYIDGNFVERQPTYPSDLVGFEFAGGDPWTTETGAGLFAIPVGQKLLGVKAGSHATIIVSKTLPLNQAPLGSPVSPFAGQTVAEGTFR